MMILGDNIFHGNFQCFRDAVQKQQNNGVNAHTFAYPVKDLERYGIIEFDKNRESYFNRRKPKAPKSQYAILGLNVLDGSAAKTYNFWWKCRIEKS